MELFDTYSVQFSQVLPVSGQKTLAISILSVELAKSQPRLDYFQITHSKIKTNIRLWSTYQTELFDTHFV